MIQNIQAKLCFLFCFARDAALGPNPPLPAEPKLCYKQFIHNQFIEETILVSK